MNDKERQIDWMYDEIGHAGINYSDQGGAEEYDDNHSKFRDYKKDAELIIERLGLGGDDIVVDMGCGTGAVTIEIAKRVRKVYAVDVSRAMLERLEGKAKESGVENIEICDGGFLSYEHGEEKADAVLSVAALHHLPDFWKAVAVRRVYDMLKGDGKFYLFDVVFDFDVQEYKQQLGGWIEMMAERSDRKMADEAVVHIRDEYSTLGWVMEGLIERAGFEICRRFDDFPHCRVYVCEKI